MMNLVRAIQVLLAGMLACWLVIGAMAQTAPEAPLTLVSETGRRAVSTEIVGGREMIALEEVASVFGVVVREDALVGGVTLTVGGQTIALSPDQPLASVGGRIVALPAPVTRVDGRWLVPLDFLSRALAPVADTPIELRQASRLLLVGDIRVPRVTARVDPVGSGARATLDLAPAAAISSAVDDRRVVIRVAANALDFAGGPVTGTGVIASVQVEAPSTLVVALGPDAAAPVITPATSGDAARIVIEVPSTVATAAPPAPVLPLATPAPPSAAPATARRPPEVVLDVIVIDPGHGGNDIGVRGAGGTAEKDVTLAVARQLQALIETRLGARVLLTRDADRTVPLDERTVTANNNKADLFLSLHAGGAPVETVSGAEVLHVRLGREGESARLRAANAVALPVLGGGSRTIDAVRWDLAQAPHVDTSATLASILVEALARRVPMGPRPRRDAPLRLLMGTNMPAAMVEIGYLTNAEQEQRLRSDPYQATVAEALYDAILRFRGFLETGGTP